MTLGLDEETSAVVACPECGRVMWRNSTHETHGPEAPVETVPDAPQSGADYEYKDKQTRRRPKGL